MRDAERYWAVAHYLDTSALVKLVVAERETAALRGWLTEERSPVGCDLARTELIRAVRRVAPDRAVLARAVLDSITLLGVPASTFQAAGLLEPVLLPSLDSVHLAAALTFDPQIALGWRIEPEEPVSGSMFRGRGSSPRGGGGGWR